MFVRNVHDSVMGAKGIAYEAGDHCRVVVSHDGNHGYATLEGEVDVTSAPMVREALFDLVQVIDAHSVEIDLSDLHFIDSTGLSALVSVLHHMQSSGGRLSVKNPSQQVHKLFDITGLSFNVGLVPL